MPARTRNGIGLVCTVVWIVVAPGRSPGAVVRNISTGVDPATGAVLPNNAPDPSYRSVPTGTGESTGTIIAKAAPLPPPYVPDAASNASRWIAINSGQGQEGISVFFGKYNFETTVDLTGFDASTAAINAPAFAVDDGLEGVQVNGVTVYTPPGGVAANMDHFEPLPANLGAGAFHAGLNTITFNLVNAVHQSPLAFRLEGRVRADPVPEPTGAAVVLLGAAVPLGRRTRSRRAGRGLAPSAAGEP